MNDMLKVTQKVPELGFKARPVWFLNPKLNHFAARLRIRCLTLLSLGFRIFKMRKTTLPQD